MVCIVGLGNPGSEYTQSRHNVGFMVVDEIAIASGIAFHPGKGEFWFGQCSFNDKKMFLLKPTTSMNNSGIAVQEFLQQQEIPLEDLLVVCDDFQLPLGVVRLRPSGTDGGHNGLGSVIYHLQTDRFSRLRCGIASDQMPKEKFKSKDFVLERFSQSEASMVKPMIERAREVCLSYLADGIDRAMNKYNTKPSGESN
jgi:peptidyl-tRNA hydrolase, PTH1 family